VPAPAGEEIDEVRADSEAMVLVDRGTAAGPQAVWAGAAAGVNSSNHESEKYFKLDAVEYLNDLDHMATLRQGWKYLEIC
jgi:hypothetical protein